MLDSLSKLLRSRSLLLTVVAVALTALMVFSYHNSQVTRRTIPKPTVMRYSELLTAVRTGQVDSIAIQPGSAVMGWFSAGARTGDRVALDGAFRVEYGTRDVDALVAAATAANIGVAFDPPASDRSAMANLIGTLLITLGIGALLYVAISRQTGGAAGMIEITARGSSRPTTTFADVAGNAAALADLREVVSFLREPKTFAGMGARVPKGILLEGPPGTGKTLMARALAGEAGTNFFAMSGPDFSGMFVGIGTMRVKALFKRARKAGGGVIFIDEIDSLGGTRGRQGGHHEDDRTLNQFLVELDGFAATDGIIVIAATNRAADLDPALLRKGRFDRSVTVALPTTEERAAILTLHATKRQIPLAPDVEMQRLARLMPGASGADLEGLLNEAAILAVRTGAATVAWVHMEEARDRVLLGRAREGFVVSDVERRLVAVHEAGHAIAGLVYSPSDPLHKVTVQPRGGAMGVAFFQPDHEAHLHSRVYLEGQIRKALGGRAAEELLYGASKITSGASSDLQHATRIAKQMVYRLGMGATTGLIIYDPESGPVSGDTHARMDADVRGLLDAAYNDVLTMLREHRTALEALGNALLDRETLTGAEALGVAESAGLPARGIAA